MFSANTMRDLLLPAFTKHSKKNALDLDCNKVTYYELLSQAKKLARTLHEMGIGTGEPVAIMLENCAEYAVTDLAIAILGAAKVPVNLMLSDEEISYILENSGAKVCVVSTERISISEKLQKQGSSLKTIVCGGQKQPAEQNTTAISWSEAVLVEELDEMPQVSPDTVAIIMYTGGTTGLPKGVVHTQKGAALNLLSHLIEMEITGSDRLLLTSPLPHSAGFLMQAAFVKGAEVFLKNNFNVADVLERISSDKISYLFMVPTMMYRVFDAIEQLNEFDARSVTTILYGAAPITQNRLEQGINIFGRVFMQLYAQSEAPNFLTKLSRKDHEIGENSHRLKSCGQAVVMAKVKVFDEDAQECAAGEVGEVVAQSPYNMREYLNNPEATAEALRGDWLHTGDVGYFDEDGYLYLVDRKKDMIITGGLNVYTTEVEQKIALVAGVQQVSVIGVPHPDWGESVVAAVVVEDDSVTPEQITKESAKHLSSYKRPKKVIILEQLPLTAVGKVDKKALRKMF